MRKATRRLGHRLPSLDPLEDRALLSHFPGPYLSPTFAPTMEVGYASVAESLASGGGSTDLESGTPLDFARRFDGFSAGPVFRAPIASLSTVSFQDAAANAPAAMQSGVAQSVFARADNGFATGPGFGGPISSLDPASFRGAIAGVKADLGSGGAPINSALGYGGFASGPDSHDATAWSGPDRSYDDVVTRRVDAAMAGAVGQLLPPILPPGTILVFIKPGPPGPGDVPRESYDSGPPGPGPAPWSRPANLGGGSMTPDFRDARFRPPAVSDAAALSSVPAAIHTATPAGTTPVVAVARAGDSQVVGPQAVGVIDAGVAPGPRLAPRGGFGAGGPARPLPDPPEGGESPSLRPQAVPAPAPATEQESSAADEIPAPLGADLISELDLLRGDGSLDGLLDELLEHFDGLGAPLREQVRDLAYVYPVVAAVVAAEAARRWRKHRSGRGPIRLWKARSRTLQIFS